MCSSQRQPLEVVQLQDSWRQRGEGVEVSVSVNVTDAGVGGDKYGILSKAIEVLYPLCGEIHETLLNIERRAKRATLLGPETCLNTVRAAGVHRPGRAVRPNAPAAS